MKVYDAKNIRNLSVVGHAGSGKTTIVESILFAAGVINRRGDVEEHNTVSDNHDLEHERNCSIFSSVLTFEHNGKKVNLLDTPGYDDYIGEMIAGIVASDNVFISVNAQNGSEVGTELGFNYAEKMNKTISFIINKLDVDQANFDETFEEIKSQFGSGCTIVQIPVKTGAGFNSIIDILSMKMLKFEGDKMKALDIPDDMKEQAESMRNELIESVAESDEDLMNKYLEEGELTQEEFNNGLKKALISRDIMPVFCGSSKNNVGMHSLLDYIENVLPSPADMPAIKLDDMEITPDPNEKVSLFVFKMVSDPKLGDMTFYRVMTGKIKQSQDLVNHQKNSSERFGQVFTILGKKREEISELVAGDIGATVKLKSTGINNTLHEKGFNIEYSEIDYPPSKVRTAIVPKTKGEEEKVGMALNNLHAEDPTIQIEHSQELRQTIVYAQGELHLSMAKWRLEHRYKVEAEFVAPRVPYRETIQSKVQSSYRHKKQSGGAGQFAEVHMMIEPYDENTPYHSDFSVRGKDLIELDWGGHLEYVNCIVGGVIDQRFMPAILKGVMEKMQEGPLTGSYVRDIRMYIYDGKMHPVDSNEAAFKIAGTMVFKDNFVNAKPKILEPIYDVSIKVPEEFVGDVMSDLPSRRGVILGIDAEGRYQKVNAKMPLAELDKYSTALRSMTQARATYTSQFAEYQAVPPNVQQELIEAYKKQQEEE